MGRVVGLTADAARTADPPVHPTADPLVEAAERMADVVAASAVRLGDRATWAPWRPGPDGRPAARPGQPCVYDGDAGTAWACAHLARALGRDDLADLAVAGTGQALDAVERSSGSWASTDRGLLSGAGGVLVAAEQVSRLLGRTALRVRVREMARRQDPLRSSSLHGSGGSPGSPDLLSGVAGDLLAGTLLEAVFPGPVVSGRNEPLAELVTTARWQGATATWTDPTPPVTRAGGASCGIAHGTSGIALALAECAAASTGRPSHTAAALVDGALAWEGAWFDPVTSGWPDLRAGGGPGASSSWCLGGSGIGAVRVRLIALVEAGRITLTTPVEALRADLDASLRVAVGDLEAGRRTGWTAQGPDGLAVSLCHGVPGPLDLLTLAADHLDAPGHRETARWYAEDLLRHAGDPRGWPAAIAGMPTDAGLFTGLSGAALTLLRVADVGDVPAPSLPLLPSSVGRPGWSAAASSPL